MAANGMQKVLAKAVKAGILMGDAAGKANPAESITREEAAAILARAFKLEAKNSDADDSFSDSVKISSWALEAVIAMAENGYVIGRKDRYFAPLDNITRAEAVKMIDNVIGELKNREGIYTGSAVGNLVVNSAGIELKDMVINGNLYLTEGIGDGGVVLDSVIVNGKIFISKDSENSIIIKSPVK